MAKEKKDYTTKILLGIIILILVVFGVYYFVNQNTSSNENINPSVEESSLIEEQKDFNLLFMRWDDYKAEYNSQTEKTEYTNQKIDWENLCSLNQDSNYYSFQTNYSGIWGCEYSINGETQYSENYLGNVQRDLRSFEEGGISTTSGEVGDYQKMSPHIDNEFTFCCDKYEKIWEGNPYGDSGYEVEKTGERVCDTITLPAKCS